MKYYPIIFLLALCLNSCTKESIDPDTLNDQEPGNEPQAQFQLEITDAPIDKPNVQACMMTISEIQIDGIAVQGFQRTSVDILALQNGKTAVLHDLDIAASSYNSITLLFDYEKDANGAAPGCYILTSDGKKDQIASTQNNLTLTHQMNLATDSRNTFVIDFDLRKAIKEKSTNDFELVSNTSLQSSARIVNKSTSGKIEGRCNSSTKTNEFITAYIYTKGSFNKNAETESNKETQFSGAVTSAKCSADGTFSIHFLNEGDYEIVFAKYRAEDDHSIQLEGLLSTNLLGGLFTNEVRVDSKMTTTLTLDLDFLISI